MNIFQLFEFKKSFNCPFWILVSVIWLSYSYTYNINICASSFVLQRERVEQLLLEPGTSHAIISDNLRKIYPGRDGNPEKVAVNGLSLALPSGECFGMLGPNGAGKTTFISMVNVTYGLTLWESLLNISLHACGTRDRYTIKAHYETRSRIKYKKLGIGFAFKHITFLVLMQTVDCSKDYTKLYCFCRRNEF